ncbi:hypothetical protein HUJ04_010426 [Dendroctonus ponderosae]|nr:hypothetical protein HUJ04_010426 [Dendroctonus ponderosae]
MRTIDQIEQRIAISRFFLWLCLTFIVTNCTCQQLLPSGSYQQDVSFPGISGQVTTANDRQPFRQVAAGFHLNRPPLLPFQQLFPFNKLLSVGQNVLKSGHFVPNGFYNFPRSPLFIPNTLKQRPESKGQEEEFRKYLEEEAENLEKEKQGNNITTDFGDLEVDPIETTSLSPNQRTFVRVNVQGNDYSYST